MEERDASPEEQARQVLRHAIPGPNHGTGWKKDAQRGHLLQVGRALGLLKEYEHHVLDGKKGANNTAGRLGVRFIDKDHRTCELVLKVYEWGLGGWVSVDGRTDGPELQPLELTYDVAEKVTYDEEGNDALVAICSWLVSQMKRRQADLSDPSRLPERFRPRPPPPISVG